MFEGLELIDRRIILNTYQIKIIFKTNLTRTS